MSNLVTGYHGCHTATARVVTSGVGFRPSENGYDWLGKGIYFWEDAPTRAAEWARRKFGDQGAVVKATIDLGHCLNLLDTTHFDRMELSFQEVILGTIRLGLNPPTNERKRHELDYLVIETYCKRLIDLGGIAFHTVRGCFPEGKSLYLGSKILRETHIQISVRDPTCITNLTVVH